MPIQQSTTGATAGNLTRHETEYRDAVMETRTYDQFASKVGSAFEPRGLTTQAAYITKLVPRPTTAQTGETVDIDPQTLRDVTKSLTKVWMTDGLKAHELVRLKSSLNPMAGAARAVGHLAMEEIDALARRVATEGTLVLYGDNTHSTRITLDLGTAGDNMSVARFIDVRSLLGNYSREKGVFTVIDDFVYADLLGASSGLIFNRAGYTEEGKRILYNYEVGMLSDIKLVVSPFAKAFYGAGADNASAVATTIAASIATPTSNQAGSTTIEVAANTNISTSKWLTIGTVQTSTESDTTIRTEIVRVASVSSTTITVVGHGPGGGLMYDHAVGEAVENGDTVHCSVFGNSASLEVDFQEYGRYGKLLPTFTDGFSKQWENMAYKYFGNYGRFDESRLVRVETSATGQ